jgi:Carboxypeptidase regulatory-like domain
LLHLAAWHIPRDLVHQKHKLLPRFANKLAIQSGFVVWLPSECLYYFHRLNTKKEKPNMLTRILSMSAVLVALLSACGGGGGGDPATGPGTNPIVNPPANSTTGAVQGRVLDASTGSGIAGAQVKAGTLTVATDAQGNYALPGVTPGQRVTVQATANNYAEGLSVAAVTLGQTSTMVTKLTPLGTAAVIDNATGGVVSVPGSSAQVTLPAGAFGASGTVSVQVTPINPALDSSVMPGDYTTAGGSQAIESFGALIVSPINSAGQYVDLVAGKTATLRIPAVAKGVPLAATIPLFYVDKNTGSWVREGTATLAGVAPNQYYEGTVTHFSTWNADQVMETVTVTGCVQDAAGVRISGVRVTSDGVNYTGSASALTNASGSFTVSMKKNATAVLTGVKGDLLSNSFSQTSLAVDLTNNTCLVLSSTAASSVKIKLTWGENPSDVDSHLITPSGEQIYFGNEGSIGIAPFANLDVDDTTSFGPEVITINRLMVGTYSYGIKLFGGTGTLTASPARVELNIGGTLRVFTPPAGEVASTAFLRMFNLVVDNACNITVVPTGVWEANRPPQVAPTSTPVYCTAP